MHSLMARETMVLLIFTIGFAFSNSQPTVLQPQAAPKSFDLTYIQNAAGSCSYVVNISTSCYSPLYTKDNISIVFGDADGNQIFFPRIYSPIPTAFARCTLGSFHVEGPCAKEICFVYLYRTGEDGWFPETVKIYNENSSSAATFTFNNSLPADKWFGFNVCSHPSSSQKLFNKNSFLYVLLGFILSLSL